MPSPLPTCREKSCYYLRFSTRCFALVPAHALRHTPHCELAPASGPRRTSPRPEARARPPPPLVVHTRRHERPLGDARLDVGDHRIVAPPQEHALSGKAGGAAHRSRRGVGARQPGRAAGACSRAAGAGGAARRGPGTRLGGADLVHLLLAGLGLNHAAGQRCRPGQGLRPGSQGAISRRRRRP